MRKQSQHPEEGNVGRICKACSEERLCDPALLQNPPAWFLGKYCLLRFPTPKGNVERMWVKVTGFAWTEGEELRGLLWNVPVLCHYRHGDVIEFSRHEVYGIEETSI